jgi:hypothetical protein
LRESNDGEEREEEEMKGALEELEKEVKTLPERLVAAAKRAFSSPSFRFSPSVIPVLPRLLTPPPPTVVAARDRVASERPPSTPLPPPPKQQYDYLAEIAEKLRRVQGRVA